MCVRNEPDQSKKKMSQNTSVKERQYNRTQQKKIDAPYQIRSTSKYSLVFLAGLLHSIHQRISPNRQQQQQFVSLLSFLVVLYRVYSEYAFNFDSRLTTYPCCCCGALARHHTGDPLTAAESYGLLQCWREVWIVTHQQRIV